ncbi:AraC family transcriptional regulator [Microvirga vignae]|uniref:AraC family transcriptional regulator n=1 Tax=Microvirga vignae TaxID=1225564 RepID=A0A0H1RBH3_9HYPH|nr:SDR family oxidoreductase [Microvirga vignae]KLK92379.1 AraC family transcriptional regulator [Microvirga vignae]
MSRGQGTALITGASAGIGAVYADRLARRGHNLVLVARNEAKLNALAARLTVETGVTIEVLRADLTDEADTSRVEARLQADDITMLVNNAGVAVAGPTIEMDPERLEAMIRLNVVVATRLARAVAPGLAQRGKGDIINIASVVALRGDQPAISVGYGASKAYVLALSEGLDSELAPYSVRVQAVLPGATRTDLWEKGGLDINALPQEIVMETGDMVDAALAGLDQGERVTIPALPDNADWSAFKVARAVLHPNLSHRQPARRYRRNSEGPSVP